MQDLVTLAPAEPASSQCAAGPMSAAAPNALHVRTLARRTNRDLSSLIYPMHGQLLPFFADLNPTPSQSGLSAFSASRLLSHTPALPTRLATCRSNACTAYCCLRRT